MISIEDYRADPCGSLSIPYWKAKGMAIPEGMQIVHQRDWREGLSEEYEDRRFFRLRHDLAGIPAGSAAGAGLRVLSPGESGEIAELIDRCYAHLGIRATPAEVERWAETRVYCPDLWIGAETDGKLVGAVLCDLDRETGEGVIEWLQVLPEYRKRGIGAALVRRALRGMVGRAGFATVSWDCGNETGPERLYRQCGFTGEDVWHILREKRGG